MDESNINDKNFGKSKNTALWEHGRRNNKLMLFVNGLTQQYFKDRLENE